MVSVVLNQVRALVTASCDVTATNVTATGASAGEDVRHESSDPAATWPVFAICALSLATLTLSVEELRLRRPLNLISCRAGRRTLDLPW
jgi:hypothetical protein